MNNLGQSRNSRISVRSQENVAVDVIADGDECCPNGVRFQLKFMTNLVIDQLRDSLESLARRDLAEALEVRLPFLGTIKRESGSMPEVSVGSIVCVRKSRSTYIFSLMPFRRSHQLTG